MRTLVFPRRGLILKRGEPYREGEEELVLHVFLLASPFIREFFWVTRPFWEYVRTRNIRWEAEEEDKNLFPSLSISNLLARFTSEIALYFLMALCTLLSLY